MNKKLLLVMSVVLVVGYCIVSVLASPLIGATSDFARLEIAESGTGQYTRIRFSHVRCNDKSDGEGIMLVCDVPADGTNLKVEIKDHQSCIATVAGIARFCQIERISHSSGYHLVYIELDDGDSLLFEKLESVDLLANVPQFAWKASGAFVISVLLLAIVLEFGRYFLRRHTVSVARRIISVVVFGVIAATLVQALLQVWLFYLGISSM